MIVSWKKTLMKTKTMFSDYHGLELRLGLGLLVNASASKTQSNSYSHKEIFEIL